MADWTIPEEITLIGRHQAAGGLPPTVPSTPFRGWGYLTWLQTVAPSDVSRLHAEIEHYTDGMLPIRRSAQVVLSVHDMSVVRQWRTHPARRLLRVPLAIVSPKLADLVVVPSMATAQEVMRVCGVNHRKIEVVPYGVREDARPALPSEVLTVLGRYDLEPGRYVLALGTIEPRKNHSRLIHAFEIARMRGAIPRDMKLSIAGAAGWHAAPILQRAQRSEAWRDIRLLGYVPSSDLGPLLTGAAAVAYPSLYEGFGLPVVEAMACGAATVTSNISSMPEVAGDAGFLVDPLDPGDIARGLAEAVAAHRDHPVQTSQRAMRRAAEFTWARAADRLRSLYRRLLDG